MKRLAIFLFTIILASACTKEQQQPEHPNESQEDFHATQLQISEEQASKLKDQIETLSVISYAEKLQCVGIVDVPPSSLYHLSSPFSGQVEKFEWLPGGNVKKGQVLFKIKSQEWISLQQDYKEIKEALKVINQELARQEGLLAEDAGVKKSVEILVGQKSQTESRLEGLSAKLSLVGANSKGSTISPYFTIIAPESGILKSILVNPGKQISPNELLAELVDVTHKHLELKVQEKDINKISEGQQIDFGVSGETTKEHHAEVFLINRAIDPQEKVLSVHAHLSESHNHDWLTVGMNVNAAIAFKEIKALKVPQSAVYANGEKRYLLQPSKNLQAFTLLEVISVGENDKEVFLQLPPNFDLIQKTYLKNVWPVVNANKESDHDH